VDFTIESKPLRVVLRWQLYAAVVIALIAALWSGAHGALSALLGGLVCWIAGLAFAMMISHRKARSAGAALRTLLRAEAGKILIIIALLWLVLATYRGVVAIAFFVGFAVSVCVSQAAILVREN
jgi:ATP synthase protein I